MSKNLFLQIVSMICALCLVIVGVGMSFDNSRTLSKRVNKQEIQTMELYKTEPIVNRAEIPYQKLENEVAEDTKRKDPPQQSTNSETVFMENGKDPVASTAEPTSSMPPIEPPTSSEPVQPESSSSASPDSKSEPQVVSKPTDSSTTVPSETTSSGQASSEAPPQSSKPVSSNPEPEKPIDPPPVPDPDPEPPVVPDGPTLLVTVNGKQIETDAQTVLELFVAMEVGSSFQVEAIKAQAVASHTYIKYQNERGKTVVLPNTAAKVTQKIRDAVAQVVNETITYNGKTIEAIYTASTAGVTRPASDVWGGYLPYMVGVESKYDSQDPNWDYRQEFTSECIKQIIETNTAIELPEDISSWITIVSHTADGYVGQVKVGDSTYSSNNFREQVMGSRIKSTWFTIEIVGDSFVFTSRGYGHCAGMSQWGANLYAKNDGWSYKQILTHYYTGTKVQ